MIGIHSGEGAEPTVPDHNNIGLIVEVHPIVVRRDGNGDESSAENYYSKVHTDFGNVE